MTKPKRITKEDSDLFRKTIGKVNRIKHDGVVFNRPEKPVIRNVNDPIGEHDNLSTVNQNIYTLKSSDRLEFKRPGIQNQLLRKLKRGQIPVETELDLHGMTIHAASESLIQFIEYCCEANHRCVRIIHGKGKGSENNLPILKNNLNQWLPKIDQVLAFCSAKPSDGGLGAIYVLIKQP